MAKLNEQILVIKVSELLKDIKKHKLSLTQTRDATRSSNWRTSWSG